MAIISKASIIALLLCITFLNYSGVLYEMYANTGLYQAPMGLDYILVAGCWAGLAAFFIPGKIARPSDLFLIFYNVICFLWGAIFWPITGLISYEQLPLFMAIMVAPNLAVLSFRGILAELLDRHIPPIQLASWRLNILPFALIALAGAFLAAQVVGSGSFDFDGVYDRRLDARGVLVANPLANYAMNMATGAVVPLLAFIAGYRRSLVAAIIALAYVVLVYWLVGQKSPMVNVTVLACIGVALRDRRVGHHFVPLLLLAGVGVYGLALAAFEIGHTTIVADVLVRRVSIIQPQIQSFYFDLWSNSGLQQMLFGVDVGGYSDHTFMVGDLYFKNAADNANVNAFLYSLAGGGVVGYLVAILTVTFVFSIFDSFYKRTRRVEFFGLAATFAILLSEQAYTTSLLSSGVALCLVLVMLFSYP